jgi:hypothetical protein
MSRYGDGRLRGILSVDVSSCFTPDREGVRVVDERSREGILNRVLAQLLEAFDRPTAARLERAVYAAHLDDDVHLGPTGVENAGRLLVHPPGSWHARPTATLDIPNLFLAADYVQTSVDLASMEGANEAGRRAARGVLRAFGLDDSRVKLFAFEALDRFAALKALDERLHRARLPHLLDLGDRVADLLPRPTRILQALRPPAAEPWDVDGPLL